MSAAIDVDVQNVSRLQQIPESTLIADWIRDTIAFVRPDSDVSVEVAVRIVDEEESKALNGRYRHTDKPTNVLAFPADHTGFATLRQHGIAVPLGDLVVCGPLVIQEAGEQSKAAEHHWHHLLVHGTLHLLGYDHEDEQQAAEMESLEARILAICGIDNPYRDR